MLTPQALSLPLYYYRAACGTKYLDGEIKPSIYPDRVMFILRFGFITLWRKAPLNLFRGQLLRAITRRSAALPLHTYPYYQFLKACVQPPVLNHSKPVSPCRSVAAFKAGASLGNSAHSPHRDENSVRSYTITLSRLGGSYGAYSREDGHLWPAPRTSLNPRVHPSPLGGFGLSFGEVYA